MILIITTLGYQPNAFKTIICVVDVKCASIEVCFYHGERACNTIGQLECAQVHICSLLTSGGAIWSRSSDGPFWNFEGEHQKRRGREHSRQGIGIDKCHAALISLSVSSPACPAQSDTHVWCWSAGAYPIMDVDMRSAESYRCLD